MSETSELVKNFYQDETGEPIVLKPGQLEIFDTIATRTIPGQENRTDKRLHIECYTQYGKSLTVGLAVLTRASTFPEKWAIVAGTKEKARVIMNYVNTHIFDNEYTRSRFRLDKGETMESVRRFRNKNHITFDLGDLGNNLVGEVFITSGKDALGLGAQNVAEDEAALIPDNEHSLIMRMLTSHPEDNFLVKIGNPFTRGHFLASRHDPKYHQIIIDCYQGVKEGRITPEMIEENRKYSYFKILYECVPPSAEEMDDSGFIYLLTDEDIKTATARVQESYGEKKLGLDVARGGRNFNAWVIRGKNFAKVIKKDRDNDLMSVVAKTEDILKSEGILAPNVFIDDTGVGGGVVDRMKEKGYKVNAVRLGEGAKDNDYLNVRAELYAGKEGVSNWIKREGKLEPHEDWIELTNIRYKKNSSGKTYIESKEDMRKRGVESPDVADALALTFAIQQYKIFKMPNPRDVLSGGGIKPFIPGVG